MILLNVILLKSLKPILLLFYPKQIPSQQAFVGIHCQNPSRKNEYTSAWITGERLADCMIKMGADAILSKVKAATKAEIIRDHEKKKQEKEQFKSLAAGEPSASLSHGNC